MTVASITERVRVGIATELARLGVEDTTKIQDAILIRDGLYCGRKFSCSGHNVVWFIEENEIKFFGPTGVLLLATSSDRYLDTNDSAGRRAA